MATLTKDSNFNPQVLADAVRSAFKGLKALYGTKAVVQNNTLPLDARGGDVLDIPYFGNLGELEDVAENAALSIAEPTASSKEQASVQRAGKAFSLTKWKEMAEAFANPYAEYARQMAEATPRRWDKALIDAAVNPTGLPSAHIIDRYDAGTPYKLQYAHIVDGKQVWGDEANSAVLFVTHSKSEADLLKQLDGENRPLLVQPNDGSLTRVGGVPLAVSDRCPVYFPTITATGTTPPTVTTSGYTTVTDKLRIEITTGGARGTAVFKWSIDGGDNYTTGVTTAATVDLGNGITVAFATGTYSTDNVYVATPKYTTIILRENALLLWNNGIPVADTDKDILRDSRIAAINTYFLAHRYKRTGMSTRPGVVLLRHN